MPVLTRAYLKSKFETKKKKKNNSMLICNNCGVYTHESIIVSRKGKKFCSAECSKIKF